MSFQHTLKLALTSSLVILSLLSFRSVAADDLIESCNSCHTPTEQGVPVINGISAFALETSLLAYVEDSRVARLYKNDDMKSIMTKLSDADFKKIIDHYPAQAFIPIKQAFNPELAAKGKVLHESYCSRCHTEGGSLADDDSSILAGQWKSYIIEEMKNYKDGSRIGDRKMTEVTKSLSDEHIQALAEYYASQQ
jgi:sulfide dehydrogenase cytochrome subunit